MAVTNADILGWLNANPGADAALINQTMAEAGVSAAQYQSATGAPPPPVAQAVAPQGMLSGPAPAPATSNPAVTNADILGWFNANPNADANLVNQTMQAAGVSPAQVASALSGNKEIAQTYLTQQILGQGTTSQWTGQGLGSAEKNAADMARLLSDAGITDINQLGKVPEYVPAQDTGQRKYNGQIVYPSFVSGSDTPTYGMYKGTGQLDNDGNEISTFVPLPPDAKLETVYGVAKDGGEYGTYYEPVDSSKLKTVDGKLLADSGQTIFGNKVTGQAVKNNYETGDNAFGGTFAGSGSTGYRVDLSSGQPIFYTSKKSNEDFKQYAPLLAIAGLGLAAPSLFAAAPGTLGVTGSTGAFLGEGALSGIAASDAALAAASFSPAGLPSGVGTFFGEGVPTGIPASDSLYTAAGGLFNPAYLAPAIPTAIPPVISAGGVPPASIPTGLPPTGLLPTGIPPALANAGVSTAINKIIGGGGTSNIGGILNTGLTTGAGLLQQQTSREAAQRAQAMIDAETAAAKASATFRPIGMTTRFGTSQFGFDPATGQLTSAGYTLSPEAKAQQDRFMALSQQGLTQAEQAQSQFAPLQTGAQRLFGLGNQYLAQSPEAVAQNYLNQQMALLQPGRETELANLQNRLQQQGRGGLSVAQGGTMGATTPELQALYNARAQQEAQLAANAQQYGQQNVAFGAGLLGTGAQTMGQYYGGQQAAYAPYTTAMGQVQSLEALGQQPFQMGATLGQTASTAGARAGALGLEGANISQRLATGSAATTNPYSTALGGLTANPAFGQLLGGLFGSGAPVNALSSSAYGPGMPGYESMLQDIYG